MNKTSKRNSAISLVILCILMTSIIVVAYVSVSQIYERSVYYSAATGGDSSGNAPWAYQMQNQQNTGYSPQTIINASNVDELTSVWNTSISGLVGTPVVVNAVIYVTATDAIDAVNETTGTLIWSADKRTIGFDIDTRVGVTINNGIVYAGSTNNSLVEVNATDGSLINSTSIIQGVTGDTSAYSGAEATPLVYNGLVFVGETVGDNGVRGFLRAFNASTLDPVWIFYTAPPSPITTSTNQSFWGNTWYTNGTVGCTCGGGAVWNVPAVDQNTGIIYFGTGNPWPNPGNNTARSGDGTLPSTTYTNLYTDTVLALNSTNGQMIWYFQEQPDDQWDHDLGMPVQLFNTTINGAETEVVGSGGKPGYYFELNAATGALIYNVSVGIHTVDNPPWNTTSIVYQAGNGGINTFSTYDNTTNMVYTIANNQPTNCGAACPPKNSTLYAINASTGAIVWNMNMTTEGGGVSSTNDIVFTSNGNHTFYALNGYTGAILWQAYDPTGSDKYTWSWGAPSITDGMVFETTWGVSPTPGQLEAYSVSVPNYKVTFKVTPTGAGTVSPSGREMYAQGSTLPISAKASSGYAFKEWVVSSGSTISIANPTAASTTATINSAGLITAKFVPAVVVSLNSSSGTVAAGGSIGISANVSGDSQDVTMSTNTLPTGISVSFSQTSFTDSPSGFLVNATISTTSGLKQKTYDIIIIATGADKQVSKETFTLTVN